MQIKDRKAGSAGQEEVLGDIGMTRQAHQDFPLRRRDVTAFIFPGNYHTLRSFVAISSLHTGKAEDVKDSRRSPQCGNIGRRRPRVRIPETGSETKKTGMTGGFALRPNPGPDHP